MTQEKCPDCGCDMDYVCSGLNLMAHGDDRLKCPTGTDRQPIGSPFNQLDTPSQTPSDATDKNVVSMSEPIENNKITTAKFYRNAALGYLIYAEQSMKSGKNPVGPEPWILETIRAALLAQIDVE